MASPDTIHLDEILAPIEGENPCGTSLRYDPAWDELAAARRGRKDAVSDEADLEPEWPRVQAVATDLLAGRTKDLQISGWLTEALVHTQGFAGLRDGLRVLHGFVDRFWEHLYPELEAEDPEVRAAPLIWLTDSSGGARLAGLLREAPIALSDGSGEVFSIASRQAFQARPKRDGESDGDYNARVREAKQKQEQFDAAVGSSPDSYYADLRADIAACLAEVDATERLVDTKLGVEYAPSWSSIREVLGEVAGVVEQICRSRGVGAETPAGGEEQAVEGGAMAAHATNGQPAGVAGPIRTRSDAVARLRDVVEYFKQTEPHSPVAHLIQRAVRWANMPLERILAELIQDESALTRIWDTLGVKAPEEPDE